MIAGRPDWCISRQRTWGVPLALFTHRETGELHPRTPELLEQVAELVEQRRHRCLVRSRRRRRCSAPRRASYEKVTDIMDVWVDSGVSHHCVSQTRPEIRIAGRPVPRRLGPASRLVPQLAADLGRAERPRAVPGRADARLHGGREGPQDVEVARQRRRCRRRSCSTLGADVLRLWVAATDYANEISVSDEILKRMSDSYRRMRNTVRFLLGNLAGLRSGARRGARRRAGRARPLGARARTSELQEEIVAAYRELRVPPDLPEGAQLLRRRHGRLLSRRAQGPAVHDAGEERRAPLGADGDVLDRRGDGALARADPLVHGRGDLAATCRASATSPCSSATWWQAARPCRSRTPVDWDAGLLEARDVVLRELERLRDRRRASARRSTPRSTLYLRRRRSIGALAAARRRTAVRADHLARRAMRRRRSGRPRRSRPSRWRRTSGSGCIGAPWSDAPKCVRCWHKRADVGADAEASGDLRPLRHESRRPGRDAPVA